jgi:hypothetical protein
LVPSKARPEVHEAALPLDWFAAAGKYDLVVSTAQTAPQIANRSVHFSVELESAWEYLAVAGGARVAEDVSAYLTANPERYRTVLASRDWHDGDCHAQHFGHEPDHA